MTKPWTIPADLWAGRTVAVLGAGPDITAELAESLRGHKTIVANDACRMAPWADMLVALDGNWPTLFRDFPGIRVTGCPDDTLDAYFVGSMYERITYGPGHEVEVRNSGLAAIRVAAMLGAAKIVLVGFNPETALHFDGTVDPSVDADAPYPHLAAGLASVITSTRAQGIEVEHITESAVILRSADDTAVASVPKARSRMATK